MTTTNNTNTNKRQSFSHNQRQAEYMQAMVRINSFGRNQNNQLFSLLNEFQANRDSIEEKHILIDRIGNAPLKEVKLIEKPSIDSRNESRRGVSCLYQTHFSKAAMAKAKMEIAEQSMRETLPILGAMIKAIV